MVGMARLNQLLTLRGVRVVVAVLRFCRGMSLSKPQQKDLLKRVQDDTEVQRVIREVPRALGALRPSGFPGWGGGRRGSLKLE